MQESKHFGGMTALAFGLILLGLSLLWRACHPAGAAAIEVPRRADWSATEAKAAGLMACLLGGYAGLLGRRERRPRIEESPRDRSQRE